MTHQEWKQGPMIPEKIPWNLKISSTEILPIDLSEIKFKHSQFPLHPFEDAELLTSEDSITGKALKTAAEALKNTVVPVAFPTETVYGLGADATNSDAVKNIFAVKNRFTDNPLIVHVGSIKQARELVKRLRSETTNGTCSTSADGLLNNGDQNYNNSNGNGASSKVSSEPDDVCNQEYDDIPEAYRVLIDKFWPGPLTILLPLPTDTILSPYVYANQVTVGVRIPSHPVALALAIVAGVPIAAPSANKSGFPSPTTAAHVAEDLHKRIQYVLDGGPCSVGLESTVVDGLSNPPAILRPGGISLEQIRACGGIWANVVVHKESENADGTTTSSSTTDSTMAPRAPGMKYKHYSPMCAVKLYMPGATPPDDKELLRSAYGQENAKVGIMRTRTWTTDMGCDVDTSVVIINKHLGITGEEISRNLFASLREMDDHHVTMVHVEGIEEDAEGLAVMNRLKKAASVICQ